MAIRSDSIASPLRRCCGSTRICARRHVLTRAIWSAGWHGLPTISASAGQPPAAAARPAGQVARASATASKPASASRRAHRFGLVVAMFQQQPAAGMQVRRGAGDDRAQRRQAVAAGRQRQPRLVAQRRQVRVVGGDVGRVASTRSKRRGRQRPATSRLAATPRQAQALARWRGPRPAPRRCVDARGPGPPGWRA